MYGRPPLEETGTGRPDSVRLRIRRWQGIPNQGDPRVSLQKFSRRAEVSVIGTAR